MNKFFCQPYMKGWIVCWPDGGYHSYHSTENEALEYIYNELGQR